jgi:hemerythrin-like domain-containing protein
MSNEPVGETEPQRHESHQDGDGGRSAIEVLSSEHDQLQSLFARVSSPDEDRPKVLKELLQTLTNHMAMEKQVLIPVLKARITGGDAAADQMTGEHDGVEEIVTLLERRKVNSPDVPALVTKLIDITEAHIREADSTVFPALSDALSAGELEELGAAMVSDERSLLTHAHPALPDSGPVAAVTRKVAELVDDMRDRSPDLGRTTS